MATKKTLADTLKDVANKVKKAAKRTSKKERLLSISGTVIDNAMKRNIWRWSDKYYERFLEVVNKAREKNVNQTAQAFQDMINDGVLVGIQKDYKPEDFWVDFSTFTDYFEDIVPESAEDLAQDEDPDEDVDEASYEENVIKTRTGDMTDEEREFFEQTWGR